MCVTESLCCILETNTTFLINSISIKNYLKKTQNTRLGKLGVTWPVTMLV